ncbi:MAG TPA: sigma-70 family RNA polymerase sigma factor, partial [Ktedonobacteraceae bacterium]|nr:sigma-70 family RNA polymerase sigma factor [Ktedonobacteraceae bacterium]
MALSEHDQLLEDEASDEATLIEKAQQDPTAFGELYQRYLDRIYLYLRTRLPSDEDAADMAQQVFLKALDALPEYHYRGLPFAAWLFQIARNALTDSYRRQRKTISWEGVPESSVSLPEQNPETGLLYQERIAQLRKLLDNLDPAKRELLALRFAA